MKLDELVGKYIQLRDMKAKFKAEYEAKVAKVETLLGKVEDRLLEVMNANGLEAVPTDAGTAYKAIRTSVTTADKEVFMNFIRESDEWPLLEVRPSKPAVEKYLEDHAELPPGVNMSRTTQVNVRRS